MVAHWCGRLQKHEMDSQAQTNKSSPSRIGLDHVAVPVSHEDALWSLLLLITVFKSQLRVLYYSSNYR